MKGFFALLALLMTLALVACGSDWSVGPDDGGASFNRRFHYYYEVDCRYDAFGQPYDCSDTYSMSPSMVVDLRVTRDGYATLCVDDNCSYYDPRDYDVGYNHGTRYYDFEGYDTRMVIYADGSELVYIDTYKGDAYYYYYDNPDYYDDYY
ncbi:hypothetical protein B7982_13910 [Fibrobacter sp. UWB2]|jgi:hypothetical protein|uniref:hypothetical protein n=1 Tax=unclassified Fibrobacter TaxID=2634177 RepID=UPI000B529153|nr:hypothetical protein [Fibrobacter sp. UWB2]OWV20692.1 hypothetical protein B7982_13910 [Fibrobacter sp. UWB2]